MTYFIGVVPPPEVAARIDVLRARFPGRLVERIEPHITLVAPLEVLNLDLWVSALERVAASTHPFCLQLGSPDYFDRRVLFLSVQTGSPELSELRARLYNVTQTGGQDTSSVPELRDAERAYHPHLTLAMPSFGTPAALFPAIHNEAAALAADTSAFVVASVRLYRKRGSRWSPEQDLAFSTLPEETGCAPAH
ncbi:MAG: 2'-5' RNA ligase family protein [Firmicutes bacterium]|nr:2'-5' RNA ligase family protein [Bacillota bacterium]